MSSWNALSIKEKADVMKVAVKNGISSLRDIRDKYNEFSEGEPKGKKSFEEWKKRIKEYKGLDIDRDTTYDYLGFYNDNPERAWKMLQDAPDAHFTDKYKTVYHPTFSTKSTYSGMRHPIYNPNGLEGGTWEDNNTFKMSRDGYRGPVSMDDRKSYLEQAEDNGVRLLEEDGSLPIYGGVRWDGVLPQVEVTPKQWNDLPIKDKADIMKVAVRNGITKLSDIRDKYNELALGGDLEDENLYDGGGYIYDVLPQLLRNAGLDIRVSSGYRDPNKHVGKHWKTSWHGKHGAVDIVPQGKTTYDDIRRVIYSDPTIINYMVSNGFGLLDETDPETMRRTGATGKHFHFGKDSKPAAQYAARVRGNVPASSSRVIGNPTWTQNAERMWAKAQPMYQELLDAGISPIEAAGILGNIALESSFDPNASNNISGGHWGYLQNDKNITPWVKANYGGYGHQNQMNYLIAGMQGRLPKANMGLDKRFNGYRAAMRGVTDPQQAAYLWERNYELSDNEAIPQRKYYAQYFYDRMMGNNPKAASYVPEIPEGYVFPNEMQGYQNPFYGFEPSNPQAFFGNPQSYDDLRAMLTPEGPVEKAAEEYSQAQLAREQKQQGLNNFFTVMNLMNQGNSSDSSQSNNFLAPIASLASASQEGSALGLVGNLLT